MHNPSSCATNGKIALVVQTETVGGAARTTGPPRPIFMFSLFRPLCLPATFTSCLCSGAEDAHRLSNSSCVGAR